MSGVAGKVAIITGSSSGIGAATAVLFAQHNCAVSLTGRNEERLKKVQAECIAAGLPTDKVIYTVGDIVDDELQKRLVNNTTKSLGKIDFLVNNAGTSNIEGKPVDQISVMQSLEVYDRVMNVNIRSVVSLTKLCLTQLEQNKGAIVNVSSIASLKAFAMNKYYCVSKACLDHFTRCLAAEVGQKGVRVNAVNPGMIQTEIFYRYGRTKEEFLPMLNAAATRFPISRIGQPEEVAKLIVYLSSDDAAFTTGQTHVIDGGVMVAHINPLPANTDAKQQ